MNDGRGELESADGTQLVYRWWRPDGSSPSEVVVFLHGVGGHSGQPTYEYFVDYLVESGRAVYGLDLRGFGLSGGRRGHVEDWSDYLADVERFIGAVAVENPEVPLYLFGQSLGGLIALEFAAGHDRSLWGLIVSAPAVGHRDLPGWFTALVRGLARIAPTLSINPRVDVAGFTRDAKDVERLREDQLSHRRVTARFAVEFDDAIDRVLGLVGLITMPTLVLVGSDDPVTPPDVSRQLMKLIGARDKQLIVYESGYHQPILDVDRRSVFDDIDVWIKGHRN